jgi:hypothetical protein
MVVKVEAVFAVLLVAMPMLSRAQVAQVNAVTATATIQAIDSATRSVTLKSENGEEDAFQVGPEVKRFEELKVGDKVKMTYYESLVFELRKPGQPSTPTGTTGAAARGAGRLPAGAVAQESGCAREKNDGDRESDRCADSVDYGDHRGRSDRHAEDRGQEEPRRSQRRRSHRHHVHPGTSGKHRANELISASAASSPLSAVSFQLPGNADSRWLSAERC